MKEKSSNTAPWTVRSPGEFSMSAQNKKTRSMLDVA